RGVAQYRCRYFIRTHIRSQRGLRRQKCGRMLHLMTRSCANSFYLTMRCAPPIRRMMFCSILRRALTTPHQNSGNGTAQRWKKSNLPCIPHSRTRKLHAMLSNDMVHPEQGAWKGLAPGCRQLYRDVKRLGVSTEGHDFRTERPPDWGRSFHPRSLEFCLNLDGRGAVG